MIEAAMKRKEDMQQQDEVISTTVDSNQSILMCLLKHGCGPGYPSKKMKKEHGSYKSEASQYPLPDSPLTEKAKLTALQMKVKMQPLDNNYPGRKNQFEHIKQEQQKNQLKSERQMHFDENLTARLKLLQDQQNVGVFIRQPRSPMKAEEKLQFLLSKCPAKEVSQTTLSSDYQYQIPAYQTIQYSNQSSDALASNLSYEHLKLEESERNTDAPILRCILKHLPDRSDKKKSTERVDRRKCYAKRDFGSERSEGKPVRFGRVPKNEKDRISHAMKAAQNQNQKKTMSIALLENFPHNPQSYKDQIAPYHREYSHIIEHLVLEVIQVAEAKASLVGDNWEPNFSDNHILNIANKQPIEKIVSQIVKFAKKLPGFEIIDQNDKIILLRACVVEIFLITLASLITNVNPKTIAFSGHIIFSCVFDGSFQPSPELSKALNTFVYRFKELNFKEEDLALFSAAAVVNPTRGNLFREQPVCELNGIITSYLSSSSSISLENIRKVLMELSHIYSSPNNSNSSDYDDSHYSSDERKMNISSPTSTIDEEISPPGSAESGCSTDSAGSNDSGIGMEGVQYQESHYCNNNDAMEISEEQETTASSWHRPQYNSVPAAPTQSVLKYALEQPCRTNLPKFNTMYANDFHRHKKFRRGNNSLSPPYPESSPSSSVSPSPSRVSSSPCSSSSPASPASSNSILAQTLRLPTSKGLLAQQLSKEPRYAARAKISDQVYFKIINAESKAPVPRQHLLATPSPSRLDSRTSSPSLHSSPYPGSPVLHMSSPPHSYSSPVMTPIPVSSGLGAAAMSSCANIDAPLNLSTKTPPPTATY